MVYSQNLAKILGQNTNGPIVISLASFSNVNQRVSEK